MSTPAEDEVPDAEFIETSMQGMLTFALLNYPNFHDPAASRVAGLTHMQAQVLCLAFLGLLVQGLVEGSEGNAAAALAGLQAGGLLAPIAAGEEPVPVARRRPAAKVTSKRPGAAAAKAGYSTPKPGAKPARQRTTSTTAT